jgi:YidC/Oxa1 family membrane protein insertase
VEIFDPVLDAFQSALLFLHDLFVPLAGVHSWGFAIIALTLIVRLLLLPLAIKQIRSMRAMQAIQPKMKEIQKKHKVDRSLMKQDPDQYRAKKEKLNKEMMALYQAEGVNPAASCLPLVAQAPVFIALFNILRGERAAELAGQPFYFVTSQVPEEGLTALVSAAGWPGWIMIVLMGTTMFVSQKQMMARQATAGTESPMAQQQKIMLYVMPVFLAVISFNLPLGVLLYWVTTNLWQAVQQSFMLREVKNEADEGTLAAHPGGEAARSKPSGKRGGSSRGASSGTASAATSDDDPSPGGAESGTGTPGGDKKSPNDKRAGGASSGRGRANGDGSKGSSARTGPKSSRPGGSPNKAGSNGAGSNGAGNRGNGSSPSGKREHIPRRGDR